MNGAIVRNEGRYSETTIDDECVVMSLATGDFFSLTGTARSIWTLIDGRNDLDAISRALATEYGAEPAEIAADVAAFVHQLAANGLVSRG